MRLTSASTRKRHIDDVGGSLIKVNFFKQKKVTCHTATPVVAVRRTVTVGAVPIMIQPHQTHTQVTPQPNVKTTRLAATFTIHDCIIKHKGQGMKFTVSRKVILYLPITGVHPCKNSNIRAPTADYRGAPPCFSSAKGRKFPRNSITSPDHRTRSSFQNGKCVRNYKWLR